MTVHIRSYEEHDLEMCRELWVQLTEWHRDIYESPGIGGDNPGLQFDEQLDKVGSEQIWLAEVDGEVVGMTGLEPGIDEGTLQIEPLIVVPEARGSGVGKALVEHLIGVIKSKGQRDLNVRVVGRNSEAIRFYHEMGFDTIGYIELFLDTTPDAEQMWREGESLAGRSFRV